MCAGTLEKDPRVLSPSDLTSHGFVALIDVGGNRQLKLWLLSKDYASALQEALMESDSTNCGCLLLEIRGPGNVLWYLRNVKP